MVETIYKIHGCPLRIALLADIHNKGYHPAVASVRAYAPDIIAIAGDIIYGSGTATGSHSHTGPDAADSMGPLIVEMQANVLPFLESCAGTAPTYLSLGNHEQYLCPDDLRLITSTGVKLLDNAFTAVLCGSAPAVIGGLSSSHVTDYRRFVMSLPDSAKDLERYPKRVSPDGAGEAMAASGRIPETAWLEDFAAAFGYHILLCHHPEYTGLIPGSVELTLSGHAHGGKWRYWSPRTRQTEGVFAPGQGLWPRLTGGVHDRENGGQLVISRGLANTARLPRINNPTEVVFIEPA